MATLATVVCTSHSGFLYVPPEEWTLARVQRATRGAIRSDVPVDSPDANHQKHARCLSALDVLRQHLEQARPDVLLIFGDDQGEQLQPSNYPAFALFVGGHFEGYRTMSTGAIAVGGAAVQKLARTAEHWASVRGDATFARWLTESLIQGGFDLAFSTELPRPGEGMGHAFMRPLYYLTPSYELPVIPFMVNCYFPPQPTGQRCLELGRAVRRAIEAYPADLRVAVIGSGGLWHTPNVQDAYLDEEFDRRTLNALASGRTSAVAAHFDRGLSEPSPPDATTGMRGGVSGGTGETRTWIIAAAVAEQQPATVVDYVPVYASPIGMAFAYWERV